MLIERHASLAQLHKLTEQLKEGRGSIALISGEAGIGKTALLEAFRRTLDRGFLVKWGVCDPLDTPRVLGPLHDMSQKFSPRLRELLLSGATFSQILPLVLSELETSDKPNVIIVEDMHWADKATLDIFKCIGRRISFLNTLLILSFRDDEVESRQGLSQLLGDFPQADTRRIKLDAMTAAGVAALAKAHNQNSEGIFEVTRGNPFYVTELLASNDTLGEAVPASIQDAINSRLNRLAFEVQDFLESVSVVPYPIDGDVIDYLIGIDAEVLADTCVAQGLLTQASNGAFRFRHELARLGTLARVSRTGRIRLHKKLVEFSLAGAGNASGITAATKSNQGLRHDRLTYHAHAAGLPDVVLEHAPKAAELASASGAHQEAASHLATALESVEFANTEQAATLYESWAYEIGLTKIDSSTIKARTKALALWRELDRPDKVGENLRWLSRLHWYQGESEQANRYLDESVAILESAEPSVERALAYSLKSQYYMLNDRMGKAIEWGLKALQIEKQFEDIDVRVHALNNVGTAYLFSDDTVGLEYMESSLHLALEQKLHEHAARVYTNLSDYAVGSRQFELAEKTIEEGISFDSSHDLDSWTFYLTGYLAQLRMEQGRLHDAETIAQGVMDLEDQTLLMKLPALLVLSRTRMRLNRKNASSLAKQALDNAISTGEAQYIVPARLTLVEYAWLNNDKSLGVTQLEEINALDSLPAGAWRGGALAIWLIRFGIGSTGLDASTLGSPYRLEIAGQLESAAEEWMQLQSPYEAAMCLMQGDLAGQSQRLQKAVQLLNSMFANGATNKVKFFTSLHQFADCVPSVGRGPQAPARLHPLGLTKKEQELLPLIVSGCSNKNMSKILGRSPRTVENHVASILAKFKVSSRMDVMLRVKSAPWLMSESHDLDKSQKQKYPETVH